LFDKLTAQPSFPITGLHALILKLSRPIDFACRDAGAHAATVKNLGAYVSHQVIESLSETVYPASVETELLALRQLFVDYDGPMTAAARLGRLAEARAIVARLALAAEGKPIPPKPYEPWADSIQYAKGVGPKRAVTLSRLGIRTVEDALWFLPWRYEDRSVIVPIGRLTAGRQATVCGLVQQVRLKQTARRRLTIVTADVRDQTGSVTALFFNQPYLEKLLQPGVRVMLSGPVTAGRGGWTDLHMESPQYEVLGEEGESPLHVGRIVPIYHETRGISSRLVRMLVSGLLEEHGDRLSDPLPAALRRRLRLPALGPSLRAAHFPAPGAALDALNRGVSPAHRRLAFEELFIFELALALRHRSVQEESKGIRFDAATPLVDRLKSLLPFRLTEAQERVVREIQGDMAGAHPMNRLLQGDVGSGKTIVALIAMLTACGAGYQAVLMAPTEVLAEQHFLTLRPWLRALGIEAAPVTSRGTSKERARVREGVASGAAQVVIGTHALIQKGVRFAKLGLAIIDEQHKFGVLQRKTLVEKGYHPDVLILTATPIPRTLAMTVYGDLDVSVIDALPPGRRPVRTMIFREAQRRQAFQILRDEVRAGRQGYVVYPLVEESEKTDLKAAMQGAERLQATEFRACRVGLLHGRLKAEEKDRTMAAFKQGTVQVLVATSVVEVGVDVPKATVMVVEHAERFGLAQLHQLRGRVGRGAQQSFCLLMVSDGAEGAADSPARRRLEALVRSTDGFAIAEEDLRIRGPGEFFGVRQWGVPEFRAANLLRDGALLAQARDEAFSLLRTDPSLSRLEHRDLKHAMLRRWSAKLDLASIS
jgi:ATP-dependent DNA helicase RecG